jgi:hypothetical protein
MVRSCRCNDAGGILLTVAQAPTAHGLFLFLIVAQTIFGFGGKALSPKSPLKTEPTVFGTIVASWKALSELDHLHAYTHSGR